MSTWSLINFYMGIHLAQTGIYPAQLGHLSTSRWEFIQVNLVIDQRQAGDSFRSTW